MVNQGGGPIGKFCDLSRAFDCVQHDILRDKLCKYGIRGKAYEWISMYLDNRLQSVKVVDKGDTYMSDLMVNAQGVPQGSILGPLLFILYINELPSVIPESFTTLYADDSTFLFSDEDPNILKAKIMNALLKFSAWSSDQSLLFNTTKTNFIAFHPRQKTFSPNFDILVNNSNITKTENVKFLGVFFDSDLSFKTHCLSLSKLLNSKCFQIRNLRKTLNVDHIRLLYFSEIQSRISYGIRIWGSSPHVKNVFLSQKRILRCISNVSFLDSCRPVFVNLRILTVYGIYILDLITSVHINKNSYLKNSDIHAHDTRYKSNFSIPYQRIEICKKSHLVMGIKLYNRLPQCFKDITLVHKFKKEIKNYLVDMCPYSVEEYFEKTH